MDTIYYTKLFLTGNLKGISINTQVITDFPMKYAKWTKGKDVITGDKFQITCASFQNYSRE